MTARIEQTDIEVEDWIDGATFTQVKVEIHRNPALYAELLPLSQKIEAAEARLADLTAARRRTTDESSLGDDSEVPDVPEGEQSLGDTGEKPADVAAVEAELDELAARATAVYAEYEKDVEVWTLRALEPAEMKTIVAACPPAPKEPRPLGKGATSTAVRRYTERVQAHIEDLKAWRTLINEHAISAATLHVEVAGVMKPAPSPEGVHRVRMRPHGERHYDELYQALESITLQEVAIPAPHRAGA